MTVSMREFSQSSEILCVFFFLWMLSLMNISFKLIDYPSRSQTFWLKFDSDHTRYMLLCVVLLQIMGVLNVE
jgi:hypothetical protein